MLLIPDKDALLEELENQNIKEDILNKITIVYDHVKHISPVEDVSSIVEEIINDLYHVPYMQDTFIPMSCFKNNLGKLLFAAYYNNTETFYTIKDIAEFAGFSIKNVHKDIKYNKTLEGTTISGVYVFTKSQVNSYLTMKNKPTI